MKRSIWGEHGSFWGFLCSRRPGLPTVFDAAVAVTMAEMQIDDQIRKLRRLHKRLGLHVDEKRHER